MTTARQIGQIFKLLVKDHDDLLNFDNQYLWLKPVRHVSLRILFERGSSRDIFWPKWTMLENFIPHRHITIGIGHRWQLERPSSSPERLWRWSDPTMIKDAIDVIENETLPFLRSIDTVEKFVKFYRSKFDLYQIEDQSHRMIVDISIGDMDSAQKAWHMLASRYLGNKNFDHINFQKFRNTLTTIAEPLLSGDRSALAQILHGWEADNIKGTRIEPYWKPTPFPLEL